MTSRLMKRHLSLCLVLVMLLTAMLPVSVFDGGRIDRKHKAIFIFDIHAGSVDVKLAGYNSSHSDSSLCFGCSFGVSFSSFCRTSFPILLTSVLLSFFSSRFSICSLTIS